MKKIGGSFLILIFVNLSNLFAQDNLKVYLFPGQGSDYRLFDSLKLNAGLDTSIIAYGTPEDNMSMKAFARSLIDRIDTTREFILVGVSLGGMICVELSELIKPELTIIISSAKNNRELPLRYTMQKVLPLYDIFPGFLLTTGARIMQPLVEPDRNSNKATFQSMLKKKKPVYMKRTVEMIIKWGRSHNNTYINHVHGDRDHTIPLKNIRSPYFLIENGSHMMTLTQAEEVSLIVNRIIRNYLLK